MCKSDFRWSPRTPVHFLHGCWCSIPPPPHLRSNLCCSDDAIHCKPLLLLVFFEFSRLSFKGLNLFCDPAHKFLLFVPSSSSSASVFSTVPSAYYNWGQKHPPSVYICSSVATHPLWSLRASLASLCMQMRWQLALGRPRPIEARVSEGEEAPGDRSITSTISAMSVWDVW